MGSVTVVEAVIKHRSPFEGHQPGTWRTRDGHVGVHLSAGTVASVTQVATWPGAGEALGDALAAALACAVPARTGDTVALDRGVLVRSGPEEFLLLSGQSTDMRTLLHQHIAPATGSVTDLSHARCQIHITGDKCRDTLSKLFALDLREQQFPLEQVRLTGHHHVPCLLHRRGVDSFDIYVFTTYAFDQLVTLVDAAREYGVSLAVSHAHGAV